MLGWSQASLLGQMGQLWPIARPPHTSHSGTSKKDVSLGPLCAAMRVRCSSPVSARPTGEHLPAADDEGHAGDLLSAHLPPLSSPLFSSLSASCSFVTARARPDPWPLFRPDPVRHRSSVARAPGLLLSLLVLRCPYCTAHTRSGAMATFCRAAGSTPDRRRDRPLAQLPAAVPCASSRVSPPRLCSTVAARLQRHLLQPCGQPPGRHGQRPWTSSTRPWCLRAECPSPPAL